MKKIENKEYLRKLFLKERSNIGDLKQKTKDVNFKLLNFLKTKKNKTVAGYYPIRNEVNILSSLEFLRINDFSISLPKILKDNNPLVFCVWKKNIELVKEKYNIHVPNTQETIYPDIILVPLVVFDKFKYRIGYGGGYYDRTIEKIQRNKVILTVGIAFDEQENINIPTEEHDMKLNMIITPTRILS